MQLFFYIIFLTGLLIIFFQDLKHRAISWWTPPLILTAFILFKENYGMHEIKSSLLNLSFVCINLLMITLYFSLKEKKLLNIFDNKLGMGDVLFFVVSCFIFSFPNYLVYFFLSLLLGLVAALIIPKKKSAITIPLAGVMSLFLLAISLINQLTDLDYMGDNEWINSMLL